MFIKCGDPNGKEPASYTRFVLPFAYHLSKVECSKSDFFYAPTEDDSSKIWRERYLTEETADVLFKRAKWFELKTTSNKWNFKEFDIIFCEEDEKGYIDYDNSGKPKEKKRISVCISPPQIVLFECNESRGKDNAKTDLLQTGFLVVELYFPAKNSPVAFNDFLRLNEIFRYWQQPFEGHERVGKNGYKTLLTEAPYKIKLEGHETLANKTLPIEIYFDRWANLLNIPVTFDEKECWNLYPCDWPDNWQDAAREKALGKDIKGKNTWIVYADNRTFVWTCAITEDGGNELRRIKSHEKGIGKGKPWTFGHWIKLLNVDPPGEDWSGTHSSIEFERTWAEERTYKRWEERGTFYGFSYHSGAMLAPPSIEPPLWKHFGQMYFDQVILLLYLRITLFRFSMELNDISGIARGREEDKGEEEWQAEFQKLRWQFTLFTNLYQFPLLSNQQQALEMYTLARKCLDVDDLFKEIQQEIHSSHDYISIKEGQKQAEATTRLTVVATVGLIAALVMSFMGMSIFNNDNSDSISDIIMVVIINRWKVFAVLTAVFILLLVITIIGSVRISKWTDWLATKAPKSARKFVQSGRRKI